MPPLNFKPPECHGCPFYGDGRGFVPDQMVEGTEVLLMAQNPGEHEEKGTRVLEMGKDAVVEPCTPQPMVGKTGYFIRTTLLPLSGLAWEQVSRGNVLRCRWKHTNTLPKSIPVMRQAIEHCQSAYFRPPASTRLIVAMGNPSKWALTGRGTPLHGIESWRGWMAPLQIPWMGMFADLDVYTPRWEPTRLPPVLMTNHPADAFRDPLSKLPLKSDFAKIAKFIKGRWPLEPPTIHVQPDPGMWVNGIAFDTEYDYGRTGVTLKRYSVCTPTNQVYVIEAENHDPTGVPSTPLHLIGQNFCTSHDLPFARQLGVRLGRVDDTMVMHAVLYPGWPHDLDYLASLYATTNRWKHLVALNPILYAGIDAYGTRTVFQHLDRGLNSLPGRRTTYEVYTRPLIAIIQKARARGLKVDVAAAQRLARELDQKLEVITLMAQATVGWPIQLSSNQQVAWQIYVANAASRLAT